MARKKRKTIHRRIWLEPGNEDAMSYAAYTQNEWDEGGLNLILADCNRHIDLYITGDAKGRRKLDKLIAFLEEAREKYNASNSD